METVQAIALLLKDGGPWVFLAVLGIAYWKKDQQLAEVNLWARGLIDSAQAKARG